jgi:hypothetical protein
MAFRCHYILRFVEKSFFVILGQAEDYIEILGLLSTLSFWLCCRAGMALASLSYWVL